MITRYKRNLKNFHVIVVRTTYAEYEIPENEDITCMEDAEKVAIAMAEKDSAMAMDCPEYEVDIDSSYEEDTEDFVYEYDETYSTAY